MKRILRQSGLRRKDVVIWNVVPWCVSTAARNARVSLSQVRDAAKETQRFIGRIEKLKVIIFAGKIAQSAREHLQLYVPTLTTFHTGARSFNHAKHRRDIRKSSDLRQKMIGRS
jgi:hypothetical protein